MLKVIALVVGASLAWASAWAGDTFDAEGVVNAVKSKENKRELMPAPRKNKIIKHQKPKKHPTGLLVLTTSNHKKFRRFGNDFCRWLKK